MPNCIYCYGVKFKDWLDYHDHYQENHTGVLSASVEVEAEIRLKAIHTPRNVSGRTTAKIIAEAEADYNKLGQYLIPECR